MAFFRNMNTDEQSGITLVSFTLTTLGIIAQDKSFILRFIIT